MIIINDISEITTPYKNAVITIGNFDGVHIGHQALLRKVREQADAIDGTAVAMTFNPHPVRVLKKSRHPKHITMYEQKVELLAQTGLDILISIPFTKEFADISAKEFVENLLIKQIGVKTIVVGHDYSFGKNRTGNVDFLKSYAEENDFQVIVVDWQKVFPDDTKRISSTRIRRIITEGRVNKAKELLGRHYQIRGKVVTGRNRGGKLLGFPTANITLYDELCPKIGVYAVTVEWNGKTYKGVANIGYSPTFDDHIFTVEVHILDFNDNIYEQNIRVNFIKRLRGEIKFSNITELSEQIKKDIELARKIIRL